MGVGAIKAQSTQDTSCLSAFIEVPESQLHQPHQKNEVQNSLPFLNPMSSCPWKMPAAHTPFTKSR